MPFHLDSYGLAGRDANVHTAERALAQQAAQLYILKGDLRLGVVDPREADAAAARAADLQLWQGGSSGV